MLVLALIAQLRTPFDPFGEYPIQLVQNRDDPLSAGPSVAVGNPVRVTATKCLDHPEPVTVSGSLQWHLLEPERTSIGVVSDSIGTRIPGCEDFMFRNPWPQAAAALSRRILTEGGTPVWQITGQETPAQGGVTQTWETEVFHVIQEGD